MKTDAGERDVELFPKLERILRTHRREALACGKAGANAFVFQTANGTPIPQPRVSAAMRRAVEGSGIEVGDGQRLSMHALRHGFVTKLVGSGLDVVTVQRQAGHKKASFTLDRYSHEFKNAQTGARAAMREQVAASGFGS